MKKVRLKYLSSQGNASIPVCRKKSITSTSDIEPLDSFWVGNRTGASFALPSSLPFPNKFSSSHTGQKVKIRQVTRFTFMEAGAKIDYRCFSTNDGVVHTVN
jgi:hypothetical protein